MRLSESERVRKRISTELASTARWADENEACRSSERKQFEAMFDRSDRSSWSAYAAELYSHLGRTWMSKLRYLLYEGDIGPDHASAFTGLEGVLLQGKSGEDGFSKNLSIAALQRATQWRSVVARPEVRALTPP